MARVLAKLLGELINSKKIGDVNQQIKLTDEILKKELDIDVQYLVTLLEKDFLEKIVSKEKISNNGLEYLADIIIELGKTKVSIKLINNSSNYYKKALILYDYITKNSPDYSLERAGKINNIKRQLY